MSDNETKDYSLSELEVWIWDALENGCSPEEIHNSIRSTVLKSIKFHKSCYEGGKELFDLLSDRPYFEVVTGYDEPKYESGYPYSINEKHHSISFNPEDFKLDSPALHTDIDVENMKIHATSGYNDGWAQQYYRDELKKDGWEMTDDGFWFKEDKNDIDSEQV